MAIKIADIAPRIPFHHIFRVSKVHAWKPITLQFYFLTYAECTEKKLYWSNCHSWRCFVIGDSKLFDGVISPVTWHEKRIKLSLISILYWQNYEWYITLKIISVKVNKLIIHVILWLDEKVKNIYIISCLAYFIS